MTWTPDGQLRDVDGVSLFIPLHDIQAGEVSESLQSSKSSFCVPPCMATKHTSQHVTQLKMCFLQTEIRKGRSSAACSEDYIALVHGTFSRNAPKYPSRGLIVAPIDKSNYDRTRCA